MFFFNFQQINFSDFERTTLQRVAQNTFSVSKAITFTRCLALRANLIFLPALGSNFWDIPKFPCQVFQDCILCNQKNCGKKQNFQQILTFLSKNFSGFGESFLNRFSKLHSTGPG